MKESRAQFLLQTLSLIWHAVLDLYRANIADQQSEAVAKN